MQPNEMFSGDAVPQVPWTPAVWKSGPDALVATAQSQSWADSQDLADGILNGGDTAMSGGQTAPQNESDQLIDGSTPGDSPSGSAGRTGGRAAQWQQNLAYLRRDEPLAAWASGQHDGSLMNPGNPAP